jgi:hypothetical protein
MAISQIVARHFDRKTVQALARKGITVTGLQAIPGTGAMPFANATTGYVVNDNGTSRIWTFAQVREAGK